jgi:transketolase
MKISDAKRLAKIALNLRQDILSMIYQAQSGHPAGSLGMIDVMVALYFAGILRHDPKRPHWDKRDYFLLSNGHICPALYAVLAERKYFPREELETFRQIDSRLQGHPHFAFNQKGEIDKKILPGIEITAGPLGQGLSQAAGLAYALKMDNKKNHVFCMTSDGEQQEGQIWEAYMFAAHHQLNNLTVIIDRNQIQISGNTRQIMSLGELKLKLISFGWRVLEADAHSFTDLIEKLKTVKSSKKQPTVIIANSTPGKGVAAMEKDFHWHGKAPNKTEFESAMQELRQRKAALK